MSKKPVVLMVLDGYGLNDKTEGNAIAQAKTPVMDKLMKECPFQKGNASGLSVGLPDGQMGNSEVGHMNIGAGRIIYQELTRITKAIEEGTFFENKALLVAVIILALISLGCFSFTLFGDVFSIIEMTYLVPGILIIVGLILLFNAKGK